jgi:hypothetical protein
MQRREVLGTQGGPNFNLLRGESASVLIIDAHLYLVDRRTRRQSRHPWPTWHKAIGHRGG